MRSLFIVSLPRSFSSDLFRLARRALGLREPTWVSEGEVLNVDRYAHYGGARFDQGTKFTTRDHNPVLYSRLLDLLDQVIVEEGFVYKDVVQPFVLSAWHRNRRLRVVRIKRDLTDVTYSMLLQAWFYPRFAARHPPGATSARLWQRLFHVSRRHYQLLLPVLCRSRLAAAVVEGLARAERSLDSMPAAAVDFEDLITSEDSARRLFETLYPGEAVSVPSYINAAFRHRRERVRLQRRSASYRRLAVHVQQLRLD